MLIDKSRQISLVSFVAHALISWSIVAQQGTISRSPSFTFFPEWFWPLVFAIQALLALWGYIDVEKLRLSFYIGSCIMVGWAVATFMGGLLIGQFQPSVVWLFYIGMLKWLIAQYSLKLQKVQTMAREITNEATQRNGTDSPDTRQ